MINTVVLTGRTVKDIELKETASGVKVVSFSLAVNRGYKDANGEYNTDFFNVNAFQATAEFIAKYVKKGEMIGIEGRLQQRTWENDEGKTIYVVEVVANQITLLQPKSSSEVEPKLFSEPVKEAVDLKKWANDEYAKRTKGVNSVVKREEIKAAIAKELEEKQEENLPF